MSTKIIKVAINDLKETEHNPRKISKEDMAKLKRSLEKNPEFLEAREIVVDENLTILGGHQRVKALKALGKTEIEVKQVNGWSEEKKRNFVITDNVQSGEWDETETDNWHDELGEWEDDVDELDFEQFDEKTETESTSKMKKVTCPNCGEEFEF